MHWVTDKIRTFFAFLDRGGKGAWIAAFVLGFIFFWPIGLVLLFVWLNRDTDKKGKTMFNCKKTPKTMKSSGNAAFDAYRDATIKRLEDEQEAFKDYLKKLREAKDKEEFDRFMAESRKTSPVETALKKNTYRGGKTATHI